MSKSRKCRLDQLLIEKAWVENAAQALALVMANQVLVNEQPAKSVAQAVDLDALIRIKGQKRFVSRGGEKLFGAIESLGLQQKFQGATVLDVGSSTGGFTDCCLQLGAKQVHAVDVGKNQLAWKLRQDPRVHVMEQTDIRKLKAGFDPKVNWVLADISFNSLDRLLADIVRVVPPTGVQFLLLVKPQFELPADLVPDGGVVQDPELLQQAIDLVQKRISRLGLRLVDFSWSKLRGRAGNQEAFILARN